MSKNRNQEIEAANLRKGNISAVYRKLSNEPMPEINTIEGPRHLLIMKHCQCCKTMQPLNNFYFRSARNRKKYDDNDVRSRERICITCWDDKNK